MTSIFSSASNTVQNTMSGSLPLVFGNAILYSTNVKSRGLPGIADAGRISFGAAARPVSLPAISGTLPNVADAGRISFGAAARPVSLPAVSGTMPSVADAGRISFGAAARPANR